MKKSKAIYVVIGMVVLASMTLIPETVLAQGTVSLSQDSALRGSKLYMEAVNNFLEKKQPKIVGGELAPIGAYPWQVSLGVSWIADPYSAHFCGGTVLSERWIITAAHCVVDTSPARIAVTAGTNTLVAGATRRNVKLIIVHKYYNPTKDDNDVALMELTDPLPTGIFIKSIPLLTPSAESVLLIEDAPLAVTGWGATEFGGNKVRDLRHLDRLPFVPTLTCNDASAYNGRITENMICAGPRAGGKDSCQGDSGGPLTVETAASPKLAGIVSWGEKCAEVEKVGVYTRVTKYVDWVNRCLANSASCNP